MLSIQFNDFWFQNMSIIPNSSCLLICSESLLQSPSPSQAWARNILVPVRTSAWALTLSIHSSWRWYFHQQGHWAWVSPPLQMGNPLPQKHNVSPALAEPLAYWAIGDGRMIGTALGKNASNSHSSSLKYSSLTINTSQIIVYSCFWEEDLLSSSFPQS